MRIEICAREDQFTQVGLLEALAAVGAAPEDDAPLDVPLPTGLTRFRLGGDALTVFADAWLVDLEGPDDSVRRVVEMISAGDHG